MLSCTVTASVACSRSAAPDSEHPRVDASAGLADERVPAVLRGRFVNADGTPAIGSSVKATTHAPAAIVDADGRFALSVPSWCTRAPVIYLEVQSDGRRESVLVPSTAVTAGIELRWPASEHDDPLVILVEDDPTAQAWLDTHRWLRDAWREWMAVRDDPAAVAALWRRLAVDIEATSDVHRRMLMQAAQFVAGASQPELGLDRREVAERALAELGLDNPRWAIWPMALPAALHDAGRWSELGRELDATIASHPQAEVAAYIAVLRYYETIADGRWAEAEAVWATAEARPEFAETFYGPILASFGPDRRLAPGKFLPAVCVEELGGDRLCTNELDGLTVVEVWSEGCKGCRESFAKLGELLPRLRAEKIAVELVTMNPWQDAEDIEAYLASNPLPGRHTWVQVDDRERLREQLEITSVPILLIVGPDARILDSTPSLQLETLEARLRHWHAPSP
jgi:hypothetical protein